MNNQIKFLMVFTFLFTCSLSAQTGYQLLSEQITFSIPDDWQITNDPENLMLEAVNATGTIKVTIWEVPVDFETVLFTNGEGIGFDYQIADFGDYQKTEISAFDAAISDLNGISNSDNEEYRILSVIYKLEEFLTATFKAEISSNATSKEIKQAEKIAYTVQNMK
ncbi:MAG: hypothetical protein L6Q59_02850 [Ignavibacteriaceae bacterium]|nr:hypothetical protein [Ignavibacteriaceae bacterium]